ncbi:MAG: FAD-dependent oxidoreductase [Pseudomonadota bacterium]
MDAQQVVVVGNGMVGHRCVELLATTPADFKITVVGGEPRPAYDRVHLSEFFAGRTCEDLALATEAGYTKLGIRPVYGDPVAAIEPQSKTVTTRSGLVLGYDILILATGSYPFVPPIPGNDSAHCLTYRTIEDLEQIKASAAAARVGVVVGGGLLGLECANALHNLGLETHVVEFAPGLMGVQLDSSGSKMLRRQIEGLGVRVHTQKATKSIMAGDKRRLHMEFADGESLDTDMIVFSAGIRPHDQLARDSGLAVGERGGIVVDDQCRTSDAHIFAIGECALWQGRILGLVSPGYKMAETAVAAIRGAPACFTGADMSTKLKLLGIQVGSIGDAHGRAKQSMSFSFSDPTRQVYKSICTSADGERLLGAVLVGDTDDYDTLLQCHLNQLPLPASPEQLVLPGGVSDVQSDPCALPDTAMICSCNSVTKGSIHDAIKSGCKTLDALKATTKAGTGCGGCTQTLEVLLASLNSPADQLAEHTLECSEIALSKTRAKTRAGSLEKALEKTG